MKVHELLWETRSSNSNDVIMPPKTRYENPDRLNRIKQIETGLSDILKNRNELKPLNEIAKQLGTSFTTIRRQFPELCDQIKSLRRKHYQSPTQLNRIRHLETGLLEIVENRNDLRSLTEIAKQLGTSAPTLRKHFPELCDRISSLRKHHVLDDTLLRFNEVNRSSIREFLTLIVNSETRPYPTLTLIAKTVGLTIPTLRRQFPELCAQIRTITKQQRIDETRLSAISSFLTDMVNMDNESRPSLEKTAQRFRVSISSLYHHFPELCAQITSLRRQSLPRE